MLCFTKKGESVIMVLNEFVTRLEFLEEYVRIIEGNYQYHTTLLISILGFVIAAAGASLYFLAKSLVNSKVDEQLNIRMELLKSQITMDVKNHIFENPQLLVKRFKAKVLSYNNTNTIVVRFTEHGDLIPETSDLFSSMFKFHSILSGKIFDFKINIKDDIISIYLTGYDRQRDGDEVMCQLILLNRKYANGSIDES